MKRWFFGAAAALALCAGGWYFASPSIAMSGLRDAALAGDRQALAERVDFPAIRESLKEQVRAYMMKSIQNDDFNPFAALGLMMAGAIIDGLIDSAVSPSGLKVMVDRGKLDDPNNSLSDDETAPVKWEIIRDGIDIFRAIPKNDADAEIKSNVSLVFRRDGLGWDLVDIEINE
ncbi:MAG: DUF2939 domain-containing protein [Polymorphobacter sp.]|uniref:DUF2939 domain-containing protein n=1 Tax=Polymorphobacter sp. TaxID=1909290 RepID=UPI003A8A626D